MIINKSIIIYMNTMIKFPYNNNKINNNFSIQLHCEKQLIKIIYIINIIIIWNQIILTKQLILIKCSKLWIKLYMKTII